MSQEEIPFRSEDKTNNQENQIKSFDIKGMLPGFESIREASKAERCEVSKETLKSGIRIPNARTLESIKNFLSENKIFDLSKFQFEDATYEGKTKYVLKLSEDGKTIHIYLDKGTGEAYFPKVGFISSDGNYQKSIGVFNILDSENFINKTSVSDNTNLECTVEKLDPGSGVIDPVRVEEVEKKLQAIKDAEAIAQYEAELKKQEYTVQNGDTLINIVKNKYGLKFNQSALSVVEEIVKYNTQKNIDLSDDSNPKDGISGDKLKVGQTIYLPQNNEIEEIQNRDKIRRYETNKAKNIKMKQSFIDEVQSLIAEQKK